ncbi:hypothetical protein HK096_009345, partial [Nowakowskiella sp. JEL0078]
MQLRFKKGAINTNSQENLLEQEIDNHNTSVIELHSQQISPNQPISILETKPQVTYPVLRLTIDMTFQIFTAMITTTLIILALHYTQVNSRFLQNPAFGFVPTWATNSIWFNVTPLQQAYGNLVSRVFSQNTENLNWLTLIDGNVSENLFFNVHGAVDVVGVQHNLSWIGTEFACSKWNVGCLVVGNETNWVAYGIGNIFNYSAWIIQDGKKSSASGFGIRYNAIPITDEICKAGRMIDILVYCRQGLFQMIVDYAKESIP